MTHLIEIITTFPWDWHYHGVLGGTLFVLGTVLLTIFNLLEETNE